MLPLSPALRPMALAAALALGACTPMSSTAQTTPYVATDGTLLNVSAQGEAKRVPDIATLSTGVVTRAADSNAAMRANAEQMAKVVEAIKAAGIPAKDVQTSGISLNPTYQYGENQPPKITGYEAHNTVNVVVRGYDRKWLHKDVTNVIAAANASATPISAAAKRRWKYGPPSPVRTRPQRPSR